MSDGIELGDGVCDEEIAEFCDTCSDDCGDCEGSCCDENSTTGCENADCTACVCGVDDFCCGVSWDTLCAQEATENCPTECGCGSSGQDCCSINDEPGCGDLDGEDCVCSLDPGCCEDSWTEECQRATKIECVAICSCE